MMGRKKHVPNHQPVVDATKSFILACGKNHAHKTKNLDICGDSIHPERRFSDLIDVNKVPVTSCYILFKSFR